MSSKSRSSGGKAAQGRERKATEMMMDRSMRYMDGSMTHRFCQFQVGGSEDPGGGFASAKQDRTGQGAVMVFVRVSVGFP